MNTNGTEPMNMFQGLDRREKANIGRMSLRRQAHTMGGGRLVFSYASGATLANTVGYIVTVPTNAKFQGNTKPERAAPATLK